VFKADSPADSVRASSIVTFAPKDRDWVEKCLAQEEVRYCSCVYYIDL
jgi:hypothetical protein